MPFLTLQFRRGTASQWSTANPTLAPGELGIETDTNQFKIGDGTSDWNTLPYGGLQGPAGQLSSIANTSTLNTSTILTDSIYFKSSIQLYGGAQGFFASTLNNVSTTSYTAVSFNPATSELGYSDFLRLSSITSLSTIQTSSLRFITTYNNVESTSKLSVSANTLLFNDQPIVAGALTSLPSTLSTLDFYTSSLKTSTLSLYQDSDSTFPVLTLSSSYLLINGQYMSSIASGGIATIPSSLSSLSFQTSSILTSTLTASTVYLQAGTTTYQPLTLSSGYLLVNGNYVSTPALATIPANLSSQTFQTSSILTSTLTASTLYLKDTSAYLPLTLSSGFLLLSGNYVSSIASGGIASIPSSLSSITFQTSSILTSTITASTLYLQDQSAAYQPLTVSSGYLLLSQQFMSTLPNIPLTISTNALYASTVFASTTNTAEIRISTTTSTGRIYADNTDLYYNGVSLTQGNPSTYSTYSLYVSSLYASTIVAPNVLQVQFYTF